MNFFIKIGALIKLINQSRISNVAEGVEPNDVVIMKQLGVKGIKTGRYYADQGLGVTHNIPHGLGYTPSSFQITLENGVTANQNYVVSVDATNITFVHQDGVSFTTTYIDWVVFG